MKRKHMLMMGNALIGLGLVVMIGSVVMAVVNQFPQVNLPQFMEHVGIFGIFFGAMLWLAGARLSGREKITDRYYWVRHCGDKRCRHGASQHNQQH